MLLQNVILSFPTLFTARAIMQSGEPRFDAQFLISPTHPQLAEVQALFQSQVAVGYPNGVPAGTNVCFGKYSDMVNNTKDYYNPELAAWYLLKTTRKEAQGRPEVVDLAYQPVIDPKQAYSGALVHVHFDMAYYNLGQGGIGGFLNAVMLTGSEGELGRIDGRPTVNQMFAGVATVATTAVTAPPVAPPAAPPVAPPPAAPTREMTPAAQGASYDQMIAAGWTDKQLIENGMMLPF